MSAQHNRAARREREVARALGTQRVKRGRYERAPDVVPIIVNGATIVPEVKTRKRLPHLVTKALAQAAGYLPGCVPMAVVSQTGGAAIACLHLSDLVRLLGIAPSNEGSGQALLPFGISPDSVKR